MGTRRVRKARLAVWTRLRNRLRAQYPEVRWHGVEHGLQSANMYALLAAPIMAEAVFRPNAAFAALWQGRRLEVTMAARGHEHRDEDAGRDVVQPVNLWVGE